MVEAPANGRPLQTPSPDLTIEMDASLLGWVTVAERKSTGVLCSEEDRQSHINHLELLGAVLALQTYSKDKSVPHVHLQMDNETAVCYHIGGPGPLQCRTQPATCGSGAWERE